MHEMRQHDDDTKFLIGSTQAFMRTFGENPTSKEFMSLWDFSKRYAKASRSSKRRLSGLSLESQLQSELARSLESLHSLPPRGSGRHKRLRKVYEKVLADVA